MKSVVKKRFQEMILKAVRKLPRYPDYYHSDTTFVAQQVAKDYLKELIEMGILISSKVDFVDNGYFIQSKVLRQLNNLHKENKVAKRIEKGEEGTGRNWTFIRWGRNA